MSTKAACFGTVASSLHLARPQPYYFRALSSCTGVTKHSLLNFPNKTNEWTNQTCHFSSKTGAVSYYDVLEITPKVGQSQIKAAYYRLSKKFHPDVNKEADAKQKFGSIAEAYEILGNKRNRMQYDQSQGFGKNSIHTRAVYDSDYQSIIKNRGDFKKRAAPVMGKTDIYDFDEFYKQHYGDYVKFNKNKSESEKAFVKELNRNKGFQLKRGLLYCSVMAFAMSMSIYFAVKATKL